LRLPHVVSIDFWQYKVEVEVFYNKESEKNNENLSVEHKSFKQWVGGEKYGHACIKTHLKGKNRKKMLNQY